jgi:caffeoyl-CoA O-methyltransferase
MTIKIAGPKAETYFEKLLPNQDFGMYWYENKDQFQIKLYNEIVALSDFEEFNKHLTIEAPKGIKQELMTTSPAGLAFLQLLLRQKEAKNVLEIGTFLGISAMYFAEAVSRMDGKVITIEKGDEFSGFAKNNFAKNNYHNIELFTGDAKELIKTTNLTDIDFVFIDGDKIHYLEIFLLLAERVKDKCILVFDDAIFHGDIFNQYTKTDHGEGVKKLINYLKSEYKWTKTLVPILNGILILEKKNIVN